MTDASRVNVLMSIWLMYIIMLISLGIFITMSILLWKFYHSIFIKVNYAFVLVIMLTCGIILAYMNMMNKYLYVNVHICS